MNNYLNKITTIHLDEFIDILQDLGFIFDKHKFKNIVNNTLCYLNGNKDKRDQLREMQDLENIWYNSVLIGDPDYTVYNNIYYLADVWVCWKKYSRQYIKNIINNKVIIDDKQVVIKDYMSNITSIADLGCGIGYTTVALKEVFGNCKVYGTNLKDTKQYAICKKVEQTQDITIVDSIEHIYDTVDMVFASEYFEHFEQPIHHLLEVLNILKPKYIVFANTFNAKSIGHFNFYKHNNINYTGKEMTRFFSNTLKHEGYVKVKTNCFNARPNIYKHV